MSASIYLDPYRPLTLLPTNQISDSSRNFREMQKHAKRPYSLTRVLRSFCTSPPKLDGFEVEVDEELKALNRGRNVVGRLVPLESLSTWRRDLSLSTLPEVIQMTVSRDEPIPFLRA